MFKRLVLAVCGTACMAAAIGAPAALAGEAPMQALLNADGSGRLFANTGTSWSWEACEADLSECEPFAAGRDISTAGAPAGTAFRLTSSGEVGVSPVWHGNLMITAPPSVSGPLRANEVVAPVPATWTGGWDGDRDLTQLAVCETAAGEGCVSITDPKYIDGYRDGSAMLDQAFVGDFLRIADNRIGPGTATTLEAYVSPFGHPIWPADGSTAVAVLGPIAPPAGARREVPGPARMIRAWISARGRGTVECAMTCRAVLVAKHGKEQVRVSRLLSREGVEYGELTQLRIPNRVLKRWKQGRVRVIVEVNGERIARRNVVLPGGRS